MRYVLAIGMIAVLGCGEDEPLAIWRDCDAAFAGLESQPRLPRDSIVPIEVGRSMPVLRITAPATDAERLANRALATACVLTGGDVLATEELPKWAEQVGAGNPAPVVGQVFDDAGMSLSAYPTGNVSMGFRVEQRTKEHDPDEEPISTDAARAIAKDVVADLVEQQLIADLDTSIFQVSTGKSTSSDIGFWFVSQVAGIPVLGMWTFVTTDADGELRSIELHDIDVEVTGQVVAAVDEVGAEQRFLELAQSVHSDLTVFFNVAPKVSYLPPFEAGAP